MRSVRHLFLICLCAFGILQSKAGNYTPDNLPMPYLQNRSHYVVNPDGILSASVTSQINSLLQRLEKERGVQTVLVVVEQIEGGDCYDFSITLGNKYGIGNRQNTGLVILLSTQDRCYQILTGEGLEGSLPDAICRRIENRQMLPFLKTGEWDQAMLATTQAICARLLKDESLLPSTQRGNNTSDLYIVGIFFALTWFLMGFSWWSNRRKNRCPNCKKGTLHRINSQVTVDRLRHVEHHHETYRCPHCGHHVLRSHDEPYDNGTGFGGIPPIIGPFGSSRRGFGGGSFGGGSFGGGSFGGGGAGGRF